MRHLLRSAFWLFATLSAVVNGWARVENSQVLILVNKDTPISAQVARMYQTARSIPAANILTLSLGSERQITPDQYWAKAAPAIKKYLDEHPEIRCIVTTSGVPYTIQATDGKDDGAAFDNELAAILREQTGDRKRHQPNPLFIQGQNAFGVTDPRVLKMVYVSRLDGPDLKTITRMVEDAVAVEKTGLEGPVYGDSQGIEVITGYGIGDSMIRGAIDPLSGAGFESKLDMKQASWKQPKGGVGDQAAGAAFYMGWYDLLDFQDIFGPRGLARGSIAWHLASQEAQNIWDANSRGWAVNLMRHGAAVTLGPVREPYLDAFPRGDIFMEALLGGDTVAEAYWLALPHTSWAMVLLGDPLYRPFEAKPKPSLIARAYVADNSTHILEKGQTSALLVQVECLGPAGSGTPALTATVEAELGLSAASGSVNIPALKAGEIAVLRIPRVTAGADATGLFRLALNAQDEAKHTRRIVLEGRIGMAKLTGGVLPKLQMYVNNAGNSLIYGQPGRSVLLDPATLRAQAMSLPQGYGIVGGEFSPDNARVALSVVNPSQKKGGIIITDVTSGATQPLPGNSQFLRWLQKDQILLKEGDQLVRHSLTGAADYTYPPLAGCPNPVTASIIPGANVQYMTTADGKSCVQRGSEPVREVMVGVKAIRFGAVANDLSAFGGVDAEKRFWLQHGLDGKPEVVATGVERVMWGPISRRAVVVDGSQKARVYDARDRSWIDLGIVTAAQWSSDEERLFFVEPGENGYLSVLIDRRVERLCPVNRIGALTGITLAADGEKAFLLAGISGGLDVWMMALPPRAPQK
jgi:uncharacterized protein (TIGR03790 family)